MMVHKVTATLVVAAIISLGIAHQAVAQSERLNFPDRRQVVINNSPAIQLSAFSFHNEFGQVGARLSTDLAWKNIGEQPITAFEVMILCFDPFNRPITSAGGSWLITGHDSANWTPLRPGESAGDGLRGLSEHPVYTGVVYVKAIRFADGAVWTASTAEVEQRIRAAMPELHDLSAVEPERKGAPPAPTAASRPATVPPPLKR